MRPLHALVPATLLLLFTGCADSPEVQFESQDVPAENSENAPQVDPTTLTYSPDLEIDFAQMEQPEPGLYYRDVEIGDGELAEAGTSITVHYTGYHPDGRVFDSSRERDEPFTVWLGVGQVIDGWDLGLEGMRAGGRRVLVIPPDLAYGAEGAGGGVVPPNAVLVFDVELISVD